MVNNWVKYARYQATLVVGSSFLPTHSAPLDTVAYKQGQCQAAT
jgi:hypothetical protein